MAVNHKKEFGFDWRLPNDRRLTVTAYHEHLKNGYNFNTTLRTVKLMALEIDTVGARPAGQQPEVVTLRTENRIADYNEPVNDVEMINKGVEFDLDLGRFESLRTSFVLNGAWMNTHTTSTGYYILKMTPAVAKNVDPDKVAVFAPGRGTADERFSTTLRIIHHIPALRFIVTLSAQTIWISKNKYLGYDSIPVGYIQRSDGTTVWLDEEARGKITKGDRELFMNIGKEYYLTESWKPLFLFNLRLTKEIGRHLGFSFYANNLTMSNPVQESSRWKGQFTRRNLPLFFGSEIKFSF
jgi:hypothetical protein